MRNAYHVLFACILSAISGYARETALKDIVFSLPNNTQVKTHGTVVDAFKDDVDPRFAFLLIQDGPYTLPIAVDSNAITNLLSWLGAEVSIVGTYHSHTGSTDDRRFANPFIQLEPHDQPTILRLLPDSSFDSPFLGAVSNLSPQVIAAMGRRKCNGIVLASWGENNSIVLDSFGNDIKVRFAGEEKPPSPGSTVTVVGQPSTDQFRIHLKRAIWRPATLARAPSSRTVSVSAHQILSLDGQPCVNARYSGLLVRITGTVRNLPHSNDKRGRMLIESDGYQIPVDRGMTSSAFVGIEPGCEVSITGICVIESEDWQPYAIFPKINTVFLVIRSPDDIVVLARPPWWTPTRIAWLIAIMAVSLLAILAWNRILNRLVVKRSRQLVREELARAKAEARIVERTHLAVELHDAMSQNLTGIAFEIDTAERAFKITPSAALPHLGLAKNALRSCREELRNCLWDLRNNALGATSMDASIRQTLAPQIGDARLFVRFNVPRRILPDTAAHAILRIIRELAVNSVRHGHARAIRVAGSIDGPLLRFSVRDDGCGFDPVNRTGVAEGHFGLDGIRERIENIGGEMSIESKIGHGTRVSFVIESSSVSRKGEPS